MTGKELVEQQLEAYESFLAIPPESKYAPTHLERETMTPKVGALRELRKDLEILGILKKCVSFTDSGHWYIDVDEYCFDTNGDENKKIKEWLNDNR